MTTPTLPPGRVRRGQLLLNGRLDVRDAEPTEVAYATKHILTHATTDADAWRRSPVDAALAELRASLGDHPRHYFGEATLRAVHTRLPQTECRRCRALMLARVYKLREPGFDAATNYLIGEGCDLCRRRPQAQSDRTRSGGVRTSSNGPASPGRSTSPPALVAGAEHGGSLTVDSLSALTGGAGLRRTGNFSIKRFKGEWWLCRNVDGRCSNTGYAARGGRWWRWENGKLVETRFPAPRPRSLVASR